MKISVLLTFFLVSLCCKAQQDELIPSQAKQLKIKQYKIINKKLKKESSPLDDKVMKSMNFNIAGNPVMQYILNVDIIYTVDSTLYRYNHKGELIEKVNFFIPSAVGQEQLAFLKEMGDAIDTTVSTSLFYYGRNGLPQMITSFRNDELAASTMFAYDSAGRLIKEERSFPIYSKSNDYVESFHYNEKGLLVSVRKEYPNDRKKYEEKWYVYDSEGKLVKLSGKDQGGDFVQDNSYGKKGAMVKQVKKVNGNINPGNFKIDYIYDSKGFLTQKKVYKNDKLVRWEKYRYNKNGLITNEYWLDEISGKVSVELVYQYQYF